MKNYQFNLIFGSLIAIHNSVVNPVWWLSIISSIIAIGYIVTGCIQQAREE